MFVAPRYTTTLVLRFQNAYYFGQSWPWSYGSWIYNYLCNQCLSPLMLWVRISIRVRWTTLCDKVCQWLATGRWFSPGTSVSSTNKTDHHDITEILLRVALNNIKQTNKQTNKQTKTPTSRMFRQEDLIRCIGRRDQNHK